MKHWILTIAAIVSLSGIGLVNAAEVEKEPLDLTEIAELQVEEQSDAAQLETVEAGDLNAGAGIFILVVIGIAIAVAS